jgi:hypothetical protein
VALAPRRRERVGRRRRAEAGVERGVEAGDRRQGGASLGRRRGGGQRLGLVQRGERGQPPQLVREGLVEPRRRAAPAAVHDPVGDRVGLPQALQRRCQGLGIELAAVELDLVNPGDAVVAVQQPQLDRARPRVDREHPHGGHPAQAGGRPGSRQSRTSGASSPCSRV